MPKKMTNCWHTQIACGWDWDDLRKMKPSLTDNQCKKVMQRLYDEFDPALGLNTDVVENMIISVLYWEEQNKLRNVIMEKAKEISG